MKTSVLVIAFACTSITGIVGWRVYADAHDPINHFAILEDQSASYTGGCESVLGSAEQILRSPGVSPRSKLMLLDLGDASTAYEPRELGKYGIPVNRKVIEGPKASERQQQAFLQKLSGTCASIRPISISPIFMGVSEAIADLRSEGCGPGAHCQLRVNSDLQENVETGIKENLASRRPRPLPASLDNDGIEVTFCGYATTSGRIVNLSSRERGFAVRSPVREDRVREVWSSVFAHAERVKFEPFCPKPSNPELYANANLERRLK